MVKVSWRQPGARWRREGESERKRTKRTREKDERAVTKWEEIRQKEASAEGGTERGNGAGVAQSCFGNVTHLCTAHLTPFCAMAEAGRLSLTF